MGHPAFRLQYLFGIIYKISPCSPISGYVRHWTIDRRVVKLVGSSPPGGVFQIRFSNYFYLSFML